MGTLNVFSLVILLRHSNFMYVHGIIKFPVLSHLFDTRASFGRRGQIHPGNSNP
jgi:hypothetical protein